MDPEPFHRALPNAKPAAGNDWQLYDRFLDLCERHRWTMASVRAEIESVDPKVLTDCDRKVLDCIGEVAVVEGNAPTIMVNQMAIMLGDAEFSQWATYQVGEEAKHFHVVRHYIRHVGHPMASQHLEATWAALQKSFDPSDFKDEYACILINVMGEAMNIHLYQVLAGRCDEPVLKQLLLRISRDERRHLQYFVEHFKKRAADDPSYVGRALISLRRMLRMDEAPTGDMQQHQGTGASSYLTASEKVLRHGYSFEIIFRTFKEQWELLQELFGDALDIDRREFYARQMARPKAPQEATAP